MKKEIAFLMFCVGVLAFLLFQTLSAGRWSARKEEQALFTKPIAVEDVTKIELRRPNEIIVFSRQRGGAWKIANPIEGQADSNKLEILLGLLAAKDGLNKLRIPIGKEKAVQEAALATFGMVSPNMGIVFQGDFGERSLWLGEKAAQDQGVYARWTQDRYVELVSPGVYDILSVPVQDFREHRILHDAGTPIVEVEMETRQQTLRLLRDGKAIFRQRGPTSDQSEIVQKADPAMRKQVFDFLENLSCKDFYDAESQILSKETLLNVGLVRGSGEETWTLQKLSTAQGIQWVFAGPARKGKFTVDPEQFQKYLTDLSWVLDRKWTDLKPEECGFLWLRAGDKGVKLVRRDRIWEFAESNAWRVDQKKVQEFLSGLFGLKITKLQGAQELPANAQATLTVGRSADDADATEVRLQVQAGQWSMHRKSDNFLFCADKPAWDFAILADGLSWRDSRVFEFQASDVKELKLIRPKVQADFVRDGAAWKLLKPKTGEADAESLDGALEKLLSVEVIRFLNRQEVARLGPLKTKTQVLLSVRGKRRELFLGPAVADGVLAKMSQDPAVFVVPKGSCEVFLMDPILFVSMIYEDSNRNGKIDQWIHYRKGRRAWMESDNDEDGKIDSKTFWRYNSYGDLIRIDADTNNDGVIDQRTFLYHGVPYRQEDDMSNSGHVDVWTTFIKGLQVRQRLDSDNDGKPDTFKKLRRAADGEIVGAQVHQNIGTVRDYVERYEGNKVLRELLPKSGN